MKTNIEKTFYSKLLIVIGLTAVIICGLIYLIATGGFNAIHQTATNGNGSTSATSDPVVTSVPTSTPDATDKPVETSTPVVIDTQGITSIQKVVTRTETIDANYVPSDLVQPSVTVNHEQLLRREASEQLEKMFLAASNEGIDLYLISGYRSFEQQTSLYYTYKDEYGEEYASSIDDIPGASEHQLGLATDLGETSHACELQTCFSRSNAYEWLINHSYEYGFILRYPEGKEDVTGVIFSPWHYRYVGIEEATKIHSTNLTMEEYYSGIAVG